MTLNNNYIDKDKDTILSYLSESYLYFFYLSTTLIATIFFSTCILFALNSTQLKRNEWKNGLKLHIWLRPPRARVIRWKICCDFHELSKQNNAQKLSWWWWWWFFFLLCRYFCFRVFDALLIFYVNYGLLCAHDSKTNEMEKLQRFVQHFVVFRLLIQLSH